jgi:hypothetical protein
MEDGSGAEVGERDGGEGMVFATKTKNLSDTYLTIKLNRSCNIRFVHEGSVFARQRLRRPVVWETELVTQTAAEDVT